MVGAGIYVAFLRVHGDRAMLPDRILRLSLGASQADLRAALDRLTSLGLMGSI
jgi:hypothetical protein